MKYARGYITNPHILSLLFFAFYVSLSLSLSFSIFPLGLGDMKKKKKSYQDISHLILW